MKSFIVKMDKAIQFSHFVHIQKLRIVLYFVVIFVENSCMLNICLKLN